MIKIIKKFKIYFVIGILVIVNLLLFSGVSPLQSIYNMQYDEWLFYLIGKGMTEGRVPYIDLMDHKGPYLFYFFALANLIPYKHIGFFIFSFIIYIFIAVFSYKISLLILGERKYRTPVALFTSLLYILWRVLIILVLELLLQKLSHFHLHSYHIICF